MPLMCSTSDDEREFSNYQLRGGLHTEERKARRVLNPSQSLKTLGDLTKTWVNTDERMA
jgi:hypothetical protein